MKETPLSISEIYKKGKENLEKKGSPWKSPPDSNINASVRMNRQYMDSLFFEPQFFDPVKPETACSILGIELKTPLFCSPLSQTDFMADDGLVEIARGVHQAGALMMLGIGGSSELQKSIDLGAKVVKMIKPYQKTDLIYKKLREAEERGCVAVGMDIDHFYGRLVGDKVDRDDLFGPQSTEEIRQIISESKLPFIIKGVLSKIDAEKAYQLGASAIMVSNHGPSSIDFTIPSMMALPRISESFGKKLTVLVDTGFKTGNDVLKALAFGAEAVGFASSMLLALMADGAAGVELLIDRITAELQRTMAATGCANTSTVDRSIIHPSPFITGAGFVK
ncbi:MAG: alpha-hydroxy-acid oxidizing protein [Deltaproteobacteria bacterium]|nr:alpha-hydroxy-acid oxidizing protein [Deltaproteobacteria bacterium]